MISIALGIQLPKLKVDFELENFFPKNDPDALFYEAHRKEFGYDNDFLFIVLENKNGIFNTQFLGKAKNFQNQLAKDSLILSIFSPLSQKHLVNGSLGLLSFPLIHVDDSSKLKQDSVRIFGNALYRQTFGNNRLSLGVYLTHKHLIDPKESELLENRITSLLESYGLDYRIIGKVPAQNRFIQYIQSDFSKFLVASLAISFLILLIIFRKWKSAMVPFLVSLVSLVWLFGFAGLMGIQINLLSSLLPPIIFFSSMSDTVHLMNALHRNSDKSIIHALRVVWLPTLLTSVTTAIGFLSLLWINTTPIQYLGLLAAVGVLFAFILTFSLGLFLAKSVKTTQKALIKLPEVYSDWLIKRKKVVISSLLLILLLISPGLFSLKIDAYLLDDLPEQDPVFENFSFVDEEYGGSKPFEVRMEIKDGYTLWDREVQKEINQLSTYLENEYPVGQIQSTSLLLSYLQMANYGGLNDQLRFPPDQSDYRRAIGLMRRLNPDKLNHIVSKDGKVTRIVGFIEEYGSRETKRKSSRLNEFIANEIDASVVGATVTGTTFIIDKSHQLLSENILKGLITAIVTISIVLGLYFRSFKLVIISMLPNIIPIVLVAGVIGLLGVPLKMTTSIIFTIALGIAVDDTIHMISGFLNNRSDSSVESLRHMFMHAGSSVLITTIILATGFGIFLFSDFGATFYMGLFISLALVLALIVDLTLLPLLLLNLKQTKKDASKR